MIVLIIGLLLFLGIHSIRIVAEDWRTRQMQRLGAGAWKGIYALASLGGFALIVWGFGLARAHPLMLYAPPVWLQHLNALFTLFAFILIAAAYVPRNHLKARLGHPMLAGVKLWALGHLLAIGYLRDVLLFGSFLAWAIAAFATFRRRDRVAGVSYPAGTLSGDAIAIVIGAAGWALFAFWLHRVLIGVSPFG